MDFDYSGMVLQRAKKWRWKVEEGGREGKEEVEGGREGKKDVEGDLGGSEMNGNDFYSYETMN